MNFTRDPIIETVITPREGCKLAIRSSKGAKQEEYLIDAVEVVSFGHSFFYRSIERPKAFLVPISDYEVFETKEPKLVLKNATHERAIKIGGGKEPLKKPEETHELQEKKTKKKKSQKNKERIEVSKEEQMLSQESNSVLKETPSDENKEPPTFISKLFPPPSTLIKETIGKYKLLETPPEIIFQVDESEISSESDLMKIDDESSNNEE